MTSKSSEPMDSGMPEQTTPEISERSHRTVFALDALVDEVKDLFGDVTFETSDTDWLNADHAVTFYLADETEFRTLVDLLNLLMDDAYSEQNRVLHVEAEDNHVLVEFTHDPVRKDTSITYGLASAYEVLTSLPSRLDGVSLHNGLTGESY